MAASGGLGNFPTVVALFKFRRRTRTCLNQTGASSAPEFEKGDHGAVRSTPVSGKSRTKVLEGGGPCLSASSLQFSIIKSQSRVGLKMAGDGLNCLLYALLRASRPLEALLRPVEARPDRTQYGTLSV